jgi:hypothetical protein
MEPINALEIEQKRAEVDQKRELGAGLNALELDKIKRLAENEVASSSLDLALKRLEIRSKEIEIQVREATMMASTTTEAAEAASAASAAAEAPQPAGPAGAAGAAGAAEPMTARLRLGPLTVREMAVQEGFEGRFGVKQFEKLLLAVGKELAPYAHLERHQEGRFRVGLFEPRYIPHFRAAMLAAIKKANPQPQSSIRSFLSSQPSDGGASS